MHPVTKHTGPDPARRGVPAVPPRVAAARRSSEGSLLRLGRGLVWSEVVRQMEEEHVIRLRRQAAGEIGYPVAEAA